MKEQRFTKIWPSGQASDFTVISGTVDKNGLDDFMLAIYLKTQEGMFLVHKKIVHKGTKFFGLLPVFYVLAIFVPVHFVPYRMDGTMTVQRFLPRWVLELPYNWNHERWT